MNNLSIGNQPQTTDGGHQIKSNQAAQKGFFNGYQISSDSSSPQSILADAAEELTFGVDNTAELDLKERKERKEKKPGDTSLVARVTLFQQMMRDAGKKKNITHLARLLEAKSNCQDMLRLTKSFFPDTTEAWAALSEIKDTLTDEKADPEILTALDQALAELEQTSGSEIRAGLAGALTAAAYEELGDPLLLKGDYQKAVINFSNPGEMLVFILDKYGADGFDRAMDFLLKALANDLAAEKPSFESAHLEAVAGQLGQVRILNGAYASGAKLAGRWQTVHGHTDSAFTATDFLQFVIKSKEERFISTSQAEPLIRLARPRDIAHEVLFLQELFNAARNLNPLAFDGLENRGRCLDVLQETLDQAIAREDEYLAALE